MSSIDSTIVATALPTLTRDLSTSISWSSWAVTAYLFGQTVAAPVAGRLSDSWGRRRMFLLFVVTFTIASLLSGLSVNVYMLVACRFVQALGGGGFMPSAVGIVSDRFGRDRDRAIGLFSSVFPIGALLGPALGGFIVAYGSWREIFFINVPVGVVLLVLLVRVLPRSQAKATGATIDVAGSLLMAGALLGVMFALNQLGERGPASVLPWALGLIGVACGAGFWMWQGRTKWPIIPPALLRRPAFGIVNGLNVLYGASALGIFSLVPLFAQDAYGLGPLQAGTLLTARALGMVAVAAAASMALRRTGYRLPMLVGFALIAIGLLLMWLPASALGPYAWLGLASMACGMGVGMAGPASNNAALELMPDQVAAISGLRGMFRQIGGIISVSVIALVIARGAGPVPVLRGAFLGLAAIAVAAIPAIVGVPEARHREP